MATHEPVLTAPDGCTKYLQSSIDTYLEERESGEVLRIEFRTQQQRFDMAEWCLNGGRRIRNPFAHFTDLTLEVSAA